MNRATNAITYTDLIIYRSDENKAERNILATSVFRYKLSKQSQKGFRSFSAGVKPSEA